MQLEGQVRIPSGCAISAMISTSGRRMTGETIVKSMIPMHDRSNGLGGGFAGYGIYPEYRDFYALHVFFDNSNAQYECEKLLKEGYEIVKSESIPIRKIPEITDVPIYMALLCRAACVGVVAIAIGREGVCRSNRNED